ncbi:MAG: hypothetical protein II998_05685 [Clostridia bacterium]|nr:hypothetical protein [Clostridia bacterium]
MDMYKETVKSGINPILSVVMWAISMYLFYILWGIAQILFEFSLSVVMYGIMLVITLGFGWFLVTKVLTEYEICISEGKLTITKIQSRRKQVLVALIALQNISDVCDAKKKKSKYDGVKAIPFTRPLQKGKEIYVIYKDDKDLGALKFKGSKKLILALKSAGK